MMVPQMQASARKLLSACAKATADQGEAVMKEHLEFFAFENAALAALGDLANDEALLVEMHACFKTMMKGAPTIPKLDVPWTPYGKGRIARRRMAEMVHELLGKAHAGSAQRNVLAQMMSTDADGKGLEEEEVVDTLVTVLVAGIATTALTMPHLVVQLHKHPEWAQRIVAEAKAKPWMATSRIEEPSFTLKLVLEALRVYPPLDVISRRMIEGELDLGEYGCVPAGTRVAFNFASRGYELGEEFDPERWSDEDCKASLAFGGRSPHHCAGKNLALLEMQVFVQVLASEFLVEVLDTELVVEEFQLGYANKLRVKAVERFR